MARALIQTFPRSPTFHFHSTLTPRTCYYLFTTVHTATTITNTFWYSVVHILRLILRSAILEDLPLPSILVIHLGRPRWNFTKYMANLWEREDTFAGEDSSLARELFNFLDLDIYSQDSVMAPDVVLHGQQPCTSHTANLKLAINVLHQTTT